MILGAPLKRLSLDNSSNGMTDEGSFCHAKHLFIGMIAPKNNVSSTTGRSYPQMNTL